MTAQLDALVEIALCELAEDRNCNQEDLSLRVFRTLQSLALEAFDLGRRHERHEHATPVVPRRY